MNPERHIFEALSFVPPEDRDTWLVACFAIKSALGDAGFDAWNTWSAQADNYNESAARTTWRCAKRDGGVQIGSLFALARKNGWKPDGAIVLPLRGPPDRAKDKLRERRAAYATDVAAEMLKSARLSTHPYLARKGFPTHQALCLRDRLLVPMRIGQELVSIQSINADGSKLFLPGSRTKGASFVMGRAAETFFCEGFVTALSVQAAMKSLYRQTQTIVCFSAGNLPVVAKSGFVVADNDASEAGMQAALKTGLPFWMPPDVGMDANDFHQAYGIRALASELNKLRRG